MNVISFCLAAGLIIGSSVHAGPLYLTTGAVERQMSVDDPQIREAHQIERALESKLSADSSAGLFLKAFTFNDQSEQKDGIVVVTHRLDGVWLDSRPSVSAINFDYALIVLSDITGRAAAEIMIQASDVITLKKPRRGYAFAVADHIYDDYIRNSHDAGLAVGSADAVVTFYGDAVNGDGPARRTVTLSGSQVEQFVRPTRPSLFAEIRWACARALGMKRW